VLLARLGDNPLAVLVGPIADGRCAVVGVVAELLGDISVLE
jgi:hypothetical protein